MSGTQPRAPIHARPWRTTEVEGAGDDAVCVKRFHDARWPGAWAGRVRDRLRARREARRLVALARGGLPVPAVLGVREGPDGVELRTSWIPGARPLAEVLGAPGTERLARPLGELLARLHGAGLSQADLHAGNVVVDAAGEPWLVDARAVRRFARTRMSEDVLAAMAALRERVTPGFRTRLFCAYLRALPERLHTAGAALRRSIESFEDLARERRAHDVVREIDRWLRASGVCVAATVDGRDLLVARRTDPDQAVEHARRALAGERPAGVDVVAGSDADVVRAWLDAATAREHGLPGAEPIALARGRRALALFQRRPGARRLGDCAELGPAQRVRVARAAGSLAGALFDRRLAVAAPDLLLGADGSASIAPAAELIRTASIAQAVRPFRGLAARRRERTAFAAAFARAQPGSPREREWIRAELARA